MNRNQAKKILPIIQALADGRTIQFAATDKEWVDLDSDDGGVFLETLINNPQSYRIKPKYRPFKDAEECWNEMLKHQPFGWVKCESCYNTIVSVSNIDVVLVSCSGDSITQPFDEVMDDSTFADGTPFGVKVEQYGVLFV